MLISICIAEYNAEKYIKRSLDSILAQSYQNIEIILFDDASTDQTRKYMLEYSQKYLTKVFSFYTDENGGVGAARNAAFCHAKGEYVLFCDCDDYMKENYIFSLVQSAQTNQFPDLVVGGFTRENAKGELLYKKCFKYEQEARYQCILPFIKMMKRSFLEQHKIFSPEGVMLEDVLYFAKLLPYVHTLSLADTCDYVWIKNLNSTSHTKMNNFYPDELDKAFTYLKSVLDNTDSQDLNVVLYCVMQFVCWYLLKLGRGIGGKKLVQEYKKAISYLEQSFPQYRNVTYVSLSSPVGTRSVVRWVVWLIAWLSKLRLATPFFYVYGALDLSRFWPDY